jgi:phosphoribosylanthranilate isomerase
MACVRIKICGVTHPSDARKAAALGADAVGINFYAQSPRFVTQAVAYDILRALPPFVDAVGVFVDQSLRQIFQTLGQLGRVHGIQWYGSDREVSDAFPYQLIAAFPVRDRNSLLSITRYLDTCRAVGQLPAALLVDAHVQGQYGGTGQTAPWQLLSEFNPGVPLILAGGLTADNVAEAIRLVHPYAVDVASGVESAPGQKDPHKMWRFIQAVREAAARY